MCQASVDSVRNNVERDDFSRSGSREMSGDFPIPQTSDGANLTSVEVRCELRRFQNEAEKPTEHPTSDCPDSMMSKVDLIEVIASHRRAPCIAALHSTARST